jgi:hypothetical protein
MNFGRRIGPIARWLMAPIGWPTIAFFLALALLANVMLRDSCLAGTKFLNLIVPVALFAVLGVTHMFVAIAQAAAADYCGRDGARPGDGRRWRNLWATYAVLVLPIWFSLPFRINFFLSRTSLDQFARNALATQTAPNLTVMIGGFTVAPSSVRITRDAVSIQLTGDSNGGTGIAYDRTGMLENVPHNNGCGALGADWYWWDED